MVHSIVMSLPQKRYLDLSSIMKMFRSYEILGSSWLELSNHARWATACQLYRTRLEIICLFTLPSLMIDKVNRQRNISISASYHHYYSDNKNDDKRTTTATLMIMVIVLMIWNTNNYHYPNHLNYYHCHNKDDSKHPENDRIKCNDW